MDIVNDWKQGWAVLIAGIGVPIGLVALSKAIIPDLKTVADRVIQLHIGMPDFTGLSTAGIIWLVAVFVLVMPYLAGAVVEFIRRKLR
jgi:hypothetical protein